MKRLSLPLYIILISLIWIMLPVLLLRWQRRERATLFSLAEHDAYMRTEYPDMRMNDWIDYWEGYLTE